MRSENPDWQLYRDGTQDHPTDPNLPGESPQHISDRADRVVAMVRGLHSSTHQDVLLFTHGHFSKVLAARFVRLPVSYAGMFQVDTSGVIVLSYAHGTMDEPTLAGMFSPSLHPKPRSPIGAPSGRHEEYQYLELIDAVIRKGEVRADRTGTGTLACFAPQHTLSFDLSDGTLPLLTTKRVFFRGVLQELLWFIGGRTDAKWLTERDIHIWDGNGSREFLEQRGLGHRREGDLGPVYGFQWRHFGAKYVDADTDYTGQGVDQLASVIRQIRENPTDRRILMSAWNPADLQDMALPPCHILCQFFVSLPDEEARAKGQRPRLSCQMYQRSCDLGLGVPFNIASYALLTHIIAAVTDCDAASFSLVMGDAHVYRDHVTPLQAQLQRQPRPFPKVQFKRAFSSIDDVQYEDVELLNYHPHGKVEMKMSV